MTNLRKAADMALEALRYASAVAQRQLTTKTKQDYSLDLMNKSMAALEAELAQPEQEPILTEKDGSPCPEFWDWLPKAYNFEDLGGFTKYNMEVAFLAGKNTALAQPEPVMESANFATNFVESKHLAQPEQEPVAWMYVNEDDECEQIEYGKPFDDPYVTPLYTAPPKREQDTNEVCKKLCAQARRSERGACHQIVWDYGFSRIDNEEVQAACVYLAQAIRGRGKHE